MKDTNKLFEAMSGIDEDLLARSEEYAQKKSKQKKIIPFIKYTSRVAAAACAVFLIGVVVTQMPKQGAASNESPRRMAEDAAQEAPMYENTVDSTQNEASYDKSANMSADSIVEAACEETQDEEEEWKAGMVDSAQQEKTDSEASVPDMDSKMAMAKDYIKIPGMSGKETYSALGDKAIQATQPIGSDTLDAPTWIPERYTYNIGVSAGEKVNLDVEFVLNDDTVKKHLKDVVVNTWSMADNATLANATGTTADDMLVVAYYIVDDKVEVAEELETLPEVVLDVEELNTEKLEEIIQTNKDAGITDIPVLNFWVWYKDDTLIYFEGNVTAEEGMEILNSIQ